MPEAYIEPFLATTNAVIASADANVDKGDLRYFRQFMPANPAGAGLALVSGGTDSAGWGQIGPAGLTTGSVTTSKHQPGGVDNNALGVNSVTTDKVLDGNITAPKLGAEAVTEPKLDAIDAPADNETLTYDLATGRFEWQPVSALASSLPDGSILIFNTLAEITAAGAHWAEWTAAAGRVLIGAGTIASVTFIEAQSVGDTDWLHHHVITSLAVSVSGSASGSGSYSGTVDATGSTDGIGNGGGVSTPTPGHQHSYAGSVSVSSSVSASGSAGGTTDSAQWIPPCRNVRYGRYTA